MDCSPDAGVVTALVKTHAVNYIELASMVFDIVAYTPLMGIEARREVVEAMEERKAVDKVREARARMSVEKVKKVFGLME